MSMCPPGRELIHMTNTKTQNEMIVLIKELYADRDQLVQAINNYDLEIQELKRTRRIAREQVNNITDSEHEYRVCWNEAEAEIKALKTTNKELVQQLKKVRSARDEEIKNQN